MSQWWQRWDEVTNGGSGRMSNGSGGMMSQEWQRWDHVTMVAAVGSCHIGGSGGMSNGSGGIMSQWWKQWDEVPNGGSDIKHNSILIYVRKCSIMRLYIMSFIPL